jgi:hypothetical protein
VPASSEALSSAVNALRVSVEKATARVVRDACRRVVPIDLANLAWRLPPSE